MIACPRCGLTNRPGVSACVRCGTPLLTPPAPNVGAGAFGSEDNLPDWLRPQQSGAQPTAPTNNAIGSAPLGYNPPNGMASRQGPPPGQGFSAASLIGEDALPEWLRSAAAQPTPQQQQPQWAQQPTQNQPTPQGWPQQRPQAPYPTSNNNQSAMNPAMPQYGQPQYGQPQYGQPPNTYAGFNGPALGAPPQYGATAQPPYGASGPNPMGANALFDESALPEWLRQVPQAPQAPQAPMTPQNPLNGMNNPQYPGAYSGQPMQAPYQQAPYQQAPYQQAAPLPSNAFPTLDQAGSYGQPPAQPRGIIGGALIDQNALPSWLGGGQPANGPPNAGMNSGGARGGQTNGMSARSLVDETALPSWLRAQPDTSLPNPATNVGVAPQLGAAPPANGWTSPMTAEERLPAWLQQAYVDANVRRIEQPQPPVGANPWAYGATGGPAAADAPILSGGAQPPVVGGMQASQLIEDSALPEWLRSQAGPQATPPQASPQAATPYSSGYGAQGSSPIAPMDQRAAPTYTPADDGGGMRFSASDLIDPAVLPQWVQGDSSAPSAASATFSSAAGWTNKQPGLDATQGAPTAGGYNMNMAASSAQPVPGMGGADRYEAFDNGDEYERNSQRGPAASNSYGAMGQRMGFDESAVAPGRGAAPMGRGPRRGAPIPDEELPPWLRSQQPASQAQRQPQRGYGAQQGGWASDQAEEQDGGAEDAGGWDGDDGADGWNDGRGRDERPDRGDYFEARDDQWRRGRDDQGEQPGQRDQRGGWRRLFGRR